MSKNFTPKPNNKYDKTDKIRTFVFDSSVVKNNSTRRLTRQSKNTIFVSAKRKALYMSNKNKQELISLLEEQRDDLLEKIKSINDTIKILQSQLSLGSGTNSSDTKDNNYDINMSLKKKVVYFIKKEQRFLHNREISLMAHKQEPEIPQKEFIKKFSSILSMLKRDGVLVNVLLDNANQNAFWGSPKWLNEDGSIKHGFEYDSKQTVGKSEKETIEI